MHSDEIKQRIWEENSIYKNEVLFFGFFYHNLITDFLGETHNIYFILKKI